MSTSSTIRIACVQMVSSPDHLQNLSTAEKLTKKAAASGAKVVALPEYFCFFGHSDRDKLKIQEKFGSGPMQDRLAKLAQDEAIYLVAGTLPISSDNPERVWNTTLVFNPLGNIEVRYDKIHLFSFKQGEESYDEAKTLIAGNQPTTFNIHLGDHAWKFGLSICYDVRFPELYRLIGEVDAHIIPAAFTYTTGSAHWEILMKARAIENQCYVIASVQGGHHENGRRTWGQSLIADPWGHILQVLPEGEGVVIGDLSKNRLNEVRSKLPALKHRKK